MARNATALLLVVMLVVVLIGIVLYHYAVVSPYRISSATARERIQQGDVDVILDVRTDVERDTLGYYPGSVHIQSADLEQQMPMRFPDRNITIVVYCNTGHRARLATDKLQALGYQKTRYISSGYMTLQ